MTFQESDIAWVFNDFDVDHLIQHLIGCGEVCLDLETTGLEEYATNGGELNGGVAARIVTAQFTAGGTNWVLPLSHPESPFQGRWRKTITRVCEQLREYEVGLIGQNIKFDLRWLYAHTGVDLSRQVVWDTRISSYLLDENSSTRLKDRAPATFGIPPWDDFDLSYPGAAEDVPLFQLGAYGARDTYWTQRLCDLHRELMFLSSPDEPYGPDEVEDARLGRLATWVAMPTIATLTAIEQRGIGLDYNWVSAELARHEKAAQELSEKLAAQYPGLDPTQASFAPTSHWFRDWTEAAVMGGDLVVAELTPTGKPRWNKEVLVRQARNGSETALDLLALRSHTKKSEYLRSWQRQMSGGVIRSSYNSATVVTGRLSSSSPNMQQVTSALKPAFVPRPGFVLADLDYSQIELRVAAFISRSEPMLDAFRRGDDLHSLLAARITGKDPSQVTKEERQAGKSANFGLLYGMGAVGFRMYSEAVYGITFTRDQAEAIHHAFFDTWDGMTQWHAKCSQTAHSTGKIISPIGRVRRIPDIFSPNEERVLGSERAAINAPVQGFASDLMQIAAASIEGNIPGHPGVENARIVATVHDSIVVEVPAEEWEKVTQECITRMLEVPEVVARMGCEFDVPLEVGATVGTRWGLSDVGTL